MLRTFFLSMVALLFGAMTGACQTEKKTDGQAETQTESNIAGPDELKPFLADVQIPMITAKEAVEKGSIMYDLTEINIESKAGEDSVRYNAVFNNLIYSSKCKFEFSSDGLEGSKVIDVFYPGGEGSYGGLGTLKGNKLKMFNAEVLYPNYNPADYRKIVTQNVVDYDGTSRSEKYGIPKSDEEAVIDCTVDNFALFTNISSREPDNKCYSVYMDSEIGKRIEEKTPTTVYKSADGMTISLKLYGGFEVPGILAIVSGEVSKASKDFQKLCGDSEIDEYANPIEEEYFYIGSVLNDKKYFYCEINADEYTYYGPKVIWSPDRLTVMGDPKKGIKDIILNRVSGPEIVKPEYDDREITD